MVRDGKMDCEIDEPSLESKIVPPIKLEPESSIRQEAGSASAVQRLFDNDMSNRVSTTFSTNRGRMGRNAAQGRDAYKE